MACSLRFILLYIALLHIALLHIALFEVILLLVESLKVACWRSELFNWFYLPNRTRLNTAWLSTPIGGGARLLLCIPPIRPAPPVRENFPLAKAPSNVLVG